MDGMLLVSKKTYSLSKHKPIVEWQSMPFSLTRLNSPHNFEIRLVEAAASGKSLEDEFKELSLDWAESEKFRTAAKNVFSYNSGLTDIAWYINSLQLAIIIERHGQMPKIVEAEDIESLKRKLKSYAA